MKSRSSPYKRYRFPPDIISYAVWLYYRFNLSHRDIEDLLAERSITVSYESIRLWCKKFGPKFARRLKRKHQGYGDTFYVDEVFVKINGKQHYLWRAVDQDGEVVDVLLQTHRPGPAAKELICQYPQQSLYFLPLPQRQGWLRLTFNLRSGRKRKYWLAGILCCSAALIAWT